jgi:hypothetical protein
VFDDFCHANDPHEEHDFGCFEADGHRIFFKIDFVDNGPLILRITLALPQPNDFAACPPTARKMPTLRAAGSR